MEWILLEVKEIGLFHNSNWHALTNVLFTQREHTDTFKKKIEEIDVM